MNFKKLLIVAISFFFALAAIIIVNAINKQKDDARKKEVLTTQILVAPITMQPGEFISLDKLVWKEWPLLSVSKQYITKNQKDLLKDLEGAVVRFPIFEGEPIIITNVIKTGGKSILAAVIRPGMRAVTVPFSKLSNAPALISPGDLIDVVIPRKKQTKTVSDDYVGQTIIRSVRVLAVDNILQKMAEGKDLSSPKTLTLEVTSDQAEDLAASIREGEIVISMRSVFSGQDVASQDFPKTEEVPVHAKEDKPTRVISLFRGSDRTEVVVK